MATVLESARCRVRVAEAMFLADCGHFVVSVITPDSSIHEYSSRVYELQRVSKHAPK